MLPTNHTVLVVLMAFILNGASQVANAQDTSETISGSITIPYPQDVAVSLGMGWNLQTNKAVTNICIENFKPFDTVVNSRIQGLIQGNNSFSLSRSLDVSSSESVSVAAGYAGLSGHASMTSQMDVQKDFDETTDDRYILAKQHIVTKWSAIESSAPGELVGLSSAAKVLISSTTSAGTDGSSSNASFYEQCGHGYVAQIEYGGSFYSLFNMHTASYTTSQSFKSHFQAAAGVSFSGLDSSASADASDSTSRAAKLSSAVNQNNVSITVLESGGAPSAAGTDMASVLEQYKSFPLRLNAVDGGESPATEFRMVIVPYPNLPPLTEFDVRLLTIAREYAKWQYLATTIGKIISSEHDGDALYTFIDGVTLSPSGLDGMQNMAQAKVDRISAVAAACMDRIRGKTTSSAKDSTDPCSLDAADTDYTKSGLNKVAWVKSVTDTVYVPVAESDVTYLVRLPFESSIYDEMSQTKTGESGATKYGDVIFNQVRGIYKERCPKTPVARFCENAAMTEQAIATYIAPASGNVYQKIQSQAGKGDVCISLLSGGKVQSVDCQNTDNTAANDAMYFYFDKDSKLVRSLTGVCLYTDRYDTTYQYKKRTHDTDSTGVHWYVKYEWTICPDKFDGSKAPTNIYSRFTDFTPVAVPKQPHVFIFNDEAINSSYTLTEPADICPVLPTAVAGETVENGSCAATNVNAQFSRTEPLFITAKKEALGIINAYISSAVVVVTPTLAHYFKAGATGVTAVNLDKVNKSVTSLYKKGTPATVNQINTYVTGLN